MSSCANIHVSPSASVGDVSVGSLWGSSASDKRLCKESLIILSAASFLHLGPLISRLNIPAETSESGLQEKEKEKYDPPRFTGFSVSSHQMKYIPCTLACTQGLFLSFQAVLVSLMFVLASISCILNIVNDKNFGFKVRFRVFEKWFCWRNTFSVSLCETLVG